MTISSQTSSQDENNAFRDDPELTLDSILIRIGEFGKFQIIIFLLICLPMLFNAIFSVAYVFTASTVTHRCNISECDGPDSEYIEMWTPYTVPHDNGNPSQCNRYSSTVLANETNDDTCSPENFNRNEIIKCPDNNFIFRDEEVTISNEFGIYCSDEWKLTMVGTINNIGQFVGIPLGGLISDKFGRRTSLALGGFLGGVFGLLRSVSPSYSYFLVFEFLDNLCSATLYSTCFIVGIELVGPSKRVIACTLITIFYAIGEVFLALVAQMTQNWRVMLRWIYAPALVMFFYFWILPESVRWLLSQDKLNEARTILKKAARVNRRRLSETYLDNVLDANHDKIEAATEGKFPIRQAGKQFFWRIMNCSFCWIVNVLVYYGLSLNAVLLDGNKYNNFIFIALVEIPGFLLPFVIMDRIGRRYSLFFFMVICGLCCLSTIMITSDMFHLQLAMFLIGKLAITASFQVLYFFTSEIFPTNLRNSLLSFCSMMGRFGSMIAPQTPLLAKLNPNAPSIVFGCTAILSGFLALLFPETTNCVLPSTIDDANSIGLKKATEKLTSVES